MQADIAQSDDESVDQYDTSLGNTPFSFIDMQPTDMCKVTERNELAITDARFFVHILDLQTKLVTRVFGKGGFGVGEFVQPSSVTTALIHTKPDCPELFYFVGDSQATQKVKVFREDGTQCAQVGGIGAAPGQFREIMSLSCFNPNLPDTPAKLGTSSVDETDNIEAISTSPIQPTCYEFSFQQEGDHTLPGWYKGMQSLDDLENMMYADEFSGNFLMARRKPFVAPRSVNSVDTEIDAEEDILPIKAPISVIPEEPLAEKIYDMLYISHTKKLDHIVIKENQDPNFPLGYFISNSVSNIKKEKKI